MSLRDVERAMIVFIYFVEKMEHLRDPIYKKIMEEEVCVFFFYYVLQLLCSIYYTIVLGSASFSCN